MKCIVQKFGGTSLGTIEKIHNAAQKVKLEVARGHKIAVVVSAMAGMTNRFIKSAESISNAFDDSEYDVVVSAGEQISSGLMALALQKIGVPARSFLGWQLPILTDGSYKKARVKRVITKEIFRAFAKKKVAVIAGFQGIDDNNRITTLGRGGSDITAVVLASALKAERCDIFTDVKGIYTCDPRIVKSAQKLDKITYEEMVEMSSLGSKVLQSRSVEVAMKKKVRLHVLSSFSNEKGTMVVDESEILEKQAVSGIACNANESKITLVGISDKPGVAAKIFGPLSDANINVDMIVQNVSADGSLTDLTFTVDKSDLKKVVSVLSKRKTAINFKKLIPDSSVAKISIVGIGMRSYPGVAQNMFKTLAKNKINILVISTSEIKISVLIARNKAKLAQRSLHKAFRLQKND
ncbi:MAG: aspartate kinase [Rickettsiales bacterium]|nr:aspartate kinase [Rickettsiales bacterium]MBV31740.1 aspartate kinase [Rickettsiales bacterium]